MRARGSGKHVERDGWRIPFMWYAGQRDARAVADARGALTALLVR